MRQIIFRGKRVDNGEWVYGVPAKDEHGEMVIVENVFERKECLCRGANCWYVDGNTIGQFTGLTDKNGKKIFEGDILNSDLYDDEVVAGFGNFTDENNGDEYIGFYISFDGIATTATQLAIEEVKNQCYIVGNIHDNGKFWWEINE